MKKYFLSMVVLCLCALIPILLPEAISQENRTSIRVNGAGIASDIVDKWAKRFMESNKDILITVVGSSAGKGFNALLDGSAEVAMMSRDIRPDERKKASEKGLKLIEKPIGNGAIALITHPRNTVNELTLEQVRKIYTGEYDNWKQVGGPDAPIRCLTRRIPESGGAVFFWNKVLHGEAFGSKTVMTETWEVIMKVCTVAEDIPIGIVPSTRNLSQVKVISIRDDEKSMTVGPTEQSIKNGSYPIVLTFGFVWNDVSSNPAVVKFADFCQIQGGGGQKH